MGRNLEPLLFCPNKTEGLCGGKKTMVVLTGCLDLTNGSRARRFAQGNSCSSRHVAPVNRSPRSGSVWGRIGMIGYICWMP